MRPLEAVLVDRAGGIHDVVSPLYDPHPVARSRRHSQTRLTTDRELDTHPAWSKNGSTVYFSSGSQTRMIIRSRSTDASGDIRTIFDGEGVASGAQLSPDGKYLVFVRSLNGKSPDIWILPMTGGLRRFRRYISEDLEPTYADEEMAIIGLNSANRAARRCM